MPTGYLQVFSRYWRLLILPPILAGAISLWSVLGAPPSYESATSVWIDSVTASPTAFGATDASQAGLPPPAAQAQQLLNELLTTRQFRLDVGQRGPLEKYLASNPSKGFGPMAMIGRLKGGGALPLEEQVVGALGPKQVLTVVAGPRVLALSVKSGNAEVAAGTLQAMLDAFGERLTEAKRGPAAAAVDLDKQEVDRATDAASSSQDDVNAYHLAHPRADDSDPILAGLQATHLAAAQRLAEATASYNDAQVVLHSVNTTAPMSVLDPPRVPPVPTRGKKALVMGLVAGLFAGCVISAFGLVALASLERHGRLPTRRRMARMRRREERAGGEQVEVVAEDEPWTGSGAPPGVRKPLVVAVAPRPRARTRALPPGRPPAPIAEDPPAPQASPPAPDEPEQDELEQEEPAAAPAPTARRPRAPRQPAAPKAAAPKPRTPKSSPPKKAAPKAKGAAAAKAPAKPAPKPATPRRTPAKAPAPTAVPDPIPAPEPTPPVMAAAPRPPRPASGPTPVPDERATGEDRRDEFESVA